MNQKANNAAATSAAANYCQPALNTSLR